MQGNVFYTHLQKIRGGAAFPDKFEVYRDTFGHTFLLLCHEINIYLFILVTLA